MIPLVNTERMHTDLKNEINVNIKSIIKSNNFINNPIIEKMQNNFARMNESKYCVGVSSGTSALSLALEAVGVGVDDEVITTTNSFFSTYESIVHVGAKPILSDVKLSDLNIDENLIEKLITKKTKAIIPVHIYGRPCNILKINQIARKYKLKVIEDCAQSHFASYDNKYVGNFSDIAAFSFYPGKNLGSFGDAGCIVTNNKSYFKIINKLKNHGRSQKYKHSHIGYNHRINSINASIINLKLKYILEWNEIRNNLSQIYVDELFQTKNIDLLEYSSDKNKSSMHLFVISVPRRIRNKLMNYLINSRIQAGIHYPIPIHMQPAVNINSKSFPNMSLMKDKIISLPLCPYTRKSEIKKVANKVKEFLNSF